MSNTATVTFRISSEQFTVLKALAAAARMPLSQFVRETVEEALELERQMERLTAFFAEGSGQPGRPV